MQRRRKELAAKQQELSAQSTVAVGGKDEAQRLRAKAEVKKLEGEITVLNMKRGEVEIANAHAAAKAEKELADELARVRDRMAEIRGGAGGDVTRARLEREYQPLIEKLQRMGDTSHLPLSSPPSMNSATPHPRTGYTVTAIGLHWLIAIAIIGTTGHTIQTFQPDLTPQQSQILELLDIPTTTYTT